MQQIHTHTQPPSDLCGHQAAEETHNPHPSPQHQADVHRGVCVCVHSVDAETATNRTPPITTAYLLLLEQTALGVDGHRVLVLHRAVGAVLLELGGVVKKPRRDGLAERRETGHRKTSRHQTSAEKDGAT